MKYNQPFNSSDPTAHYVDGNPDAGEEGSIPSAAAIENTQREIVAAIVGAGLTPTNADLTQLWQAIQTAGGQNQSSLWHFGHDSGGANAIIIDDLSPTIANYTDGLTIAVVAATDNTGAAHINAESKGDAIIKRADSSALQAGDIKGGRLLVLTYDATGIFFRITFQQTDEQAQNHYGQDTGSANLVISSVNPAITTYILGSSYGITIAANNTGPTNVNLNAKGNKPVVLNRNGAALTGGELKAGSLAVFWDDGASMRLVNPNSSTILTTTTRRTTSGSFTPALPRIKVRAWAAGGAGFTVVNGSNAAGDGGGGGEYREGEFIVTPGIAIAITIGAGGVPGVAAGLGGDTIVGTLMTAKGGGGATGSLNTGKGLGGTAGTGGVGFDGGVGGGGFTSGSGADFANFSGHGAAAFGTSIVVGPNSAPRNGAFPGGGGEGGNGGAGPSPKQIGGNGAGGLVIIKELP